MTLISGTRLGPYEIQSPLGAGGMGEVYRALDTRLDRIVAVKILPSSLSADADAKKRFDREARTISSLNHPNICTLHDVGHQDGVDYLVMEYLEGETLASRLTKGALSTDQVLKFGIEICEGLEIAHRTGVVHRDLKPGNIMLTQTGVKLLDFGLAKSLPPHASAAASLTVTGSSPAANSPVTEKGMVLGTFQYMSPEQVQGKEVDGRSDIFSLGTILYEMVTGKRAFEGKSHLSVAAAILEDEPVPIGSVKPMTSAVLDHAIVCCLAKNPEDRWQTVRDLALELKWAAAGAQTGVFTPAVQRKAGRQWLAWSVAALLGVTVVLTTFLFRGKRPSATTPVRFEIRLPVGARTFTFSPDGRQLAFLAPGADGRDVVWIRALDSLEPHPLPGTENILVPVFWSPDSRFIAFQSGSKLKKIAISGGPPQDICDAFAGVFGGAWNREGTIIFGTTGNGIMQVPAAGGVPALLTTTEGRNEVHTFPSFLPDGQHFFYLRAPNNPGIYLGALNVKPEQQNSRRILSTPVMAVYTASADARVGHLLFLREGTLLAQAFDERSLQPQGNPIPVAERVGSLFLSGLFSASPSGALAYSAGPGVLWLSQLSWFDRQGRKLGDAGQPGSYSYADFALSPDGTRLAASKVDPRLGQGETGIWLLDLLRGVSTRLTFDLSPDSAPVWSPDGSRVAFAAYRAGGYGIYQKATNGAGKEQELIRATGDPKFPDDWSRDGRFVLYTRRDPRTHGDLWVLPVAGDGTASGTAAPFANTEFSEGQGRFSPNAHWIAYASDESGRSEIYIQPFPAPPNGGSKTAISRDGGSQPRWRRDGKELFYVSSDGKLMAVDVSEKTMFNASVPKTLFQVPVAQIGHPEVNDEMGKGSLQVLGWDVAPDGKRLLIDTATKSSESVTVLLNWTVDLKKD